MMYDPFQEINDPTPPPHQKYDYPPILSPHQEDINHTTPLDDYPPILSPHQEDINHTTPPDDYPPILFPHQEDINHTNPSDDFPPRLSPHQGDINHTTPPDDFPPILFPHQGDINHTTPPDDFPPILFPHQGDINHTTPLDDYPPRLSPHQGDINHTTLPDDLPPPLSPHQEDINHTTPPDDFPPILFPHQGDINHTIPDYFPPRLYSPHQGDINHTTVPDDLPPILFPHQEYINHTTLPDDLPPPLSPHQEDINHTTSSDDFPPRLSPHQGYISHTTPPDDYPHRLSPHQEDISHTIPPDDFPPRLSPHGDIRHTTLYHKHIRSHPSPTDSPMNDVTNYPFLHQEDNTTNISYPPTLPHKDITPHSPSSLQRNYLSTVQNDEPSNYELFSPPKDVENTSSYIHRFFKDNTRPPPHRKGTTKRPRSQGVSIIAIPKKYVRYNSSRRKKNTSTQENITNNPIQTSPLQEDVINHSSVSNPSQKDRINDRILKDIFTHPSRLHRLKNYTSRSCPSPENTTNNPSLPSQYINGYPYTNSPSRNEINFPSQSVPHSPQKDTDNHSSSLALADITNNQPSPPQQVNDKPQCSPSQKENHPPPSQKDSTKDPKPQLPTITILKLPRLGCHCRRSRRRRLLNHLCSHHPSSFVELADQIAVLSDAASAIVRSNRSTQDDVTSRPAKRSLHL